VFDVNDDVRFISSNINPVNLQPTAKTAASQPVKDAGFQDILRAKVKPVIKFSAHALERLQRRNIELTPERMEKLTAAVQKAQEKGSRESLVLMDNLALIVSIKNQTVITAIDGERIKENVFTNIDSAIIT
jgi:flagellar operon protein